MTKKLRWVASLTALAALSTALAAATAGATTTPVSVEVSGTQTVVDEANGTFAMHGSLVGVWQTTKFVPALRVEPRATSRRARRSSAAASTPTRTAPVTRRSRPAR